MLIGRTPTCHHARGYFLLEKNRVAQLDIGSVVTIFRRIEFLSYVKRVPKDVRCLMKCHFIEGKGPSDIADLYFLEHLETVVEPDNTDEPYILMLRINHSFSNMNARTNGTSAVPGQCYLDGEGLRYTIQGPKLKLRLVSRISAPYSETRSNKRKKYSHVAQQSKCFTFLNK